MRAGTESARAAEPLSPQLLQFAEAQRIIVLDAIRTDFSQARQMPATSSTSTDSADKGDDPCPGILQQAACTTCTSTALAWEAEILYTWYNQANRCLPSSAGV